MRRIKVTQVPGALFCGEAPGRSLYARPPSVRRGLAARDGCYLGVDGHGGAFAEAPGHRIGKAMAAEPSPTTVDGVATHVEQDRQGFLLALIQMNDAGRIEKMAKYPDTEPCMLTSGSSGRGRAS